MIKRFFILLLAIVASVGMSYAQAGVVSSGTKGGMPYTFYDNGLLEISGSGALPGRAFTNWDGGFGTSVKNIRFAEDCEVYGLGDMWFGCYTENSQLETVEINSVVPIMFSASSGEGIFYRQDGAVTLTITAPGIVDVEGEIIGNYGSPVNMILNLPATTVFEKKWFSGLRNNFAVTIPTGAKGHVPAGYSFTDPYNQKDYDDMVEHDMEDLFWEMNSHLVEGVDYTNGEGSTFVITAENASQIFGQAAVSFQAPTEASNSEWVLWRKSDLKTFSDMSSGEQKVYKDVTVKVNNGVYNTDAGFGVHFDSSDEDGVQFVAPEGKVFKRIVILNEYGTFSDPNWSYDGNYKKWSGSANTVGFVGDICGISLIEFELEASAPATPAYETVMNLINAIGTVELTAECKAKIDAARAAYDALSDGDKAQVTNLTTLTDAETAYAQLLAQAVAAVKDQIDALPATPLTDATKKLSEYNKVLAAREAYDALSDEEKAAVTNLAKLEAVEAAFAAIGGGGGSAPAGALNGKFTINGSSVVYFSKGNLQATYDGSAWSWAFAANQWDYVGNAAANTKINGNGTVSENGTVDLFGWVGASSEFVGLAQYGITTSEATNATDGYGTNASEALKSDWGTTMGDGWFTLSTEQWQYLFNTRLTGTTVNGTANARYTEATINSDAVTPVNGIILFPENASLASVTGVTWGAINETSGWETTCTTAGWTALEEAGCVFLPAAGRRYVTSVFNAGSSGYYWSSSPDPSNVKSAYDVFFRSAEVNPANYNFRSYGYSVRLVTEALVSPLADAQAAVALINAIPSPVVYTPECSAAIKAAREAVDALGENASLLDEADLNKLTQAETAYAQLLAQAVKAVKDQIDALPATPLTDATKKLSEYNKVKAARAAYDALSDEEKAAVSNYDKLEAVEAAFAAIPPVGSETVITWDKNTGIEKISGTTTSPAYEGITISIKGGGFGPQDDMLRFNIAGLGLSFEFANTLGGNFQKIVISSTNAMPSTPLTGMGEGWAASSGNKIATWTGDAATVKIWDGLTATSFWDVNTIQFTLGATVSATEAAQAALDKINAIPQPVVLSDECNAAIKAAREAVTALGENASLLDDADMQKLTAAEAALTALNQAEADKVVAKINAIPTPVELKLATRDSIQNARAAYDALNADQQALVSNYQTLLDAEAALAALNPGVPPATPLDSAQAVKDLIDAIPDSIVYPTSGPAIAAALVAYNQLSDAAKGALDNADVQKMTNAAIQYAALDAIAAIEAIPAEIVYDPAVKAAIETAREKYDALIDASKALVGTEVLHKLTNAEQAWAILVAKIEHNVSYIGKDGELKHETVALLHIPDPAPEFNGYEFVRWDVKAGDFLEEGLRIKAIYTPIITTNPVAYDSLVYNATAQTLITAGVAKEGHIEYRINDGEWSTELPKATFAAAYVVYYKLVREGHPDYVADSIVSIIAKAPVTYTAPTAVDSLVYTAANQTLIAAGQTADGTFEYSLNPTLLDSWKTELPQAMSAGTHNVYYRVKGDLNHKDSTAVDPIAVTIAKAELTATADNKNVIYGDAVPAYTVTYAGWQGDDDTTALAGQIAYTCIYAPTSNVGEYAITPSGVSAANYDITFVNGKVTVAQALLTVTAENKTVTYGDSIPVYTATYSGFKNGDDASVVDSLAYTCAYAPTSNVGDYTITPHSATALNYTFAYVNGTLTVNKAALMITAEDKNVIYGDTIPTYTATYSGWKNGDDASVVTGLVYTCAYAPTSNVGEYTITPNSATATNYAISYTNGKVTVAKAALMITADDKNVIYGDAVPEYTATYSGWKNSDTESVVTGLAYTCEYAPTSNVGDYTITPSDATATNYAISYTNGKVTVAQATLTVTAENKTVTYGDAAPEFTATYSGWKNGDDASVVDSLAYTCAYAPTSNVGDYTITPHSATALNYTFAYVDGKVTVNKAALMITADDKTVTYGDTVPTYTASYSGWKNGDDASVVTGLVYTCEYAPTSNVGDYTITPSGATATNYAMSYTNGKVTVNKAALMITADDKNVIYGDAVPEYTATYSGWKNADNESVVTGLAYTCEYAVTSNVGEYTITPSDATATNYAISYTNGKVTVAQAALTITANDTTMIYGDEHPEFTASYSGWKNSDTESVVTGLAYTTPYKPGSPIGTYTINPNSATAQNYAITFVDGTLTVNKAVVSVSGAEAQIAKFADGHAGAVVLNPGKLNGVKLQDAVGHVTTASFSTADVAEHQTITLFYELTGNASLLNNYDLQPTSEIFSTEGVIIEPFIPDDKHDPVDPESKVEEGIEVYAYGYCKGDSVGMQYHLNTGNPDQYKIDFADPRFTNVDWTALEITGKDGVIYIDVPVDVPTGDYEMTVYFRDSRFTWLESQALTVTFHVNLPETYVRPLFDNTIVLVDTCNCFTDIQWYYREDATQPWEPIPGATGHYYHADSKLDGEFFVQAKMNGVPTYTCGQDDMETLYGEGKLKTPVVKAFPNPVVSTTTVTIENSEQFEHTLRIVNFMGAEVEKTTFTGNETNVEMGGYTQGNYMISVDGIVVKVMKK